MIRLISIILIVIAGFFCWNSGGLVYQYLTLTDVEKRMLEQGHMAIKFPLWVGFVILISSLVVLGLSLRIFTSKKFVKKDLLIILLLILANIIIYFSF